MSKGKRLTRRQFLTVSGAAIGTAALAACTSPAPAPTAAPAAPAAPTAAAAAPTAVPPTAVPPTAVPPTAVPPTAVPEAAPALGSELIGKLEGPEIILEAAKYPTKFAEAPTLAELVKAGTLPAVDARCPKQAT